MSARTIHPFPARMAPEIALAAIPTSDQGPVTVLDPMCGSGTVLAVALAHGHNAVGVDIDPLAVMMSELAVTEVNSGRIRSALQHVLNTPKGGDCPSPWGADEETEAFVDYWFGHRQKSEMVAITSAIEEVDDPSLRLTLRLALSRIIVTKSPQASLAADTAHSRPHRVQTTSQYDVFAGFEKSARQLARMLEERTLTGKGTAVLGDARQLSSVGDHSADLAVTSPPYLNALDYIRGHKLALVWFGHTIAELRARRRISIGAERAIDTEASKGVARIVDVIESDAVDASVLKRPMVERFAADCVSFALQLRRTIKPGGAAVLVVGNSTLRGNYIRNDLIAQMAMEDAGFEKQERYEREIPPSSRYMAISAGDSGSSITKRMRKEVVLTMRS